MNVAEHPTAHRRSTGRPTRGEEGGFVLIWSAMMLVVLVGFAGFSVDLGWWYLTASRLQNSADASALGGVVFLPADLAEATNVATTMAQGHGHHPSAVEVRLGERSNQLRVTVSADVESFFLKIFGIATIRMSRTALAEFEGPVPMGSPESFLGNDPERGHRPDHWMNVASLRNSPNNGDRFHAGSCGANATCLASTPQNPEYSNHGYFMAVEVTAPQPGRDLVFQIFDPAFYEVGDVCTADGNAVWGSSDAVGANAAALRAATSGHPDIPAGWYDDAEQRLVRGPGRWCPGDWRAGATTGGGGPVTTSYLVRAPDATPWLDSDNPVISTATCAPMQFRGYDRTWMQSQTIWQRLTPNSDPNGEWRVSFPDGAWRPTFANSFRRWVQVCRVPAAQVQVGTYLLQVRTNAAVGAPLAANNTVNTWGHNRYSIRAGFVDGPGRHAVPSGAGVQVYANGRLPIYVNADGADTQFHLARVRPGGVERLLNITLWDISDGGSSGSMRIVPPADATLDGAPLTTFTGCSFAKSGGTWSTNPSNCSFGFTANSLNGTLVTISVPIPRGYDCNEADPFGCWVKVAAPFAGAVNDTTTWSADIIGDPVRLIE
jgi:hypothetical protein